MDALSASGVTVDTDNSVIRNVPAITAGSASFEWVDPAKEAQGASIRLDKRLDTRKSIIGSRSGNWRRTFQQLADEQAEADRVGITLPDVEPTAPKADGDAPSTPQNDGGAPPDETEDPDPDGKEGEKDTQGDGAAPAAGNKANPAAKPPAKKK
jgi:capsid protein